MTDINLTSAIRLYGMAKVAKAAKNFIDEKNEYINANYNIEDQTHNAATPWLFGFDAVTLDNKETGEIVVGFGALDLGSWDTPMSALELGFNIHPEFGQVAQAKAYLAGVIADYPDAVITVVGLSLAGGLGQHAVQEGVDYLYTFNSTGINGSTVVNTVEATLEGGVSRGANYLINGNAADKAHLQQQNSRGTKVFKIVADGDISLVNTLGEQIDGTEIIVHVDSALWPNTKHEIDPLINGLFNEMVQEKSAKEGGGFVPFIRSDGYSEAVSVDGVYYNAAMVNRDDHYSYIDEELASYNENWNSYYDGIRTDQTVKRKTNETATEIKDIITDKQIADDFGISYRDLLDLKQNNNVEYGKLHNAIGVKRNQVELNSADDNKFGSGLRLNTPVGGYGTTPPTAAQGYSAEGLNYSSNQTNGFKTPVDTQKLHVNTERKISPEFWDDEQYGNWAILNKMQSNDFNKFNRLLNNPNPRDIKPNNKFAANFANDLPPTMQKPTIATPPPAPAPRPPAQGAGIVSLKQATNDGKGTIIEPMNSGFDAKSYGRSRSRSRSRAPLPQHGFGALSKSTAPSLATAAALDARNLTLGMGSVGTGFDANRDAIQVGQPAAKKRAKSTATRKENALSRALLADAPAPRPPARGRGTVRLKQATNDGKGTRFQKDIDIPTGGGNQTIFSTPPKPKAYPTIRKRSVGQTNLGAASKYMANNRVEALARTLLAGAPAPKTQTTNPQLGPLIAALTSSAASRRGFQPE